LKADLLAMDAASVSRAVKIVRGGGLVIFPTDTVYGIGCDPLNDRAVGRLFQVKQRSSKPVSVLCSSLERAGALVVLKGKALDLATAHWPGALTIVAPLRVQVPQLLNQGLPNLGVRVPNHPGVLKLIDLCGGWLTGTSANLSGRPSARTAWEAATQLGDSVDLVLDGGPLSGTESTVVQVVDNTVAILRTGPVGVGVE